MQLFIAVILFIITIVFVNGCGKSVSDNFGMPINDFIAEYNKCAEKTFPGNSDFYKIHTSNIEKQVDGIVAGLKCNRVVTITYNNKGMADTIRVRGYVRTANEIRTFHRVCILTMMVIEPGKDVNAYSNTFKELVKNADFDKKPSKFVSGPIEYSITSNAGWWTFYAMTTETAKKN